MKFYRNGRFDNALCCLFESFSELKEINEPIFCIRFQEYWFQYVPNRSNSKCLSVIGVLSVETHGQYCMKTNYLFRK